VDFFSEKCSGSLDLRREYQKTTTEPKELHMKAIIDQTKLEEIKAAVTPKAPLKGQAEVATMLREKGYSVPTISRYLGKHSLPVSPTAITNYFRNADSETTNN
jgi:hypothetical protein